MFLGIQNFSFLVWRIFFKLGYVPPGIPSPSLSLLVQGKTTGVVRRKHSYKTLYVYGADPNARPF
jgi:hypothetical protein